MSNNHLTIFTTATDKGLAQGSVWEWFEKEVLKGVSYSVHDVEKLTDLNFKSGSRRLLLGEKAAKVFIGPEVNLFTDRGTIHKQLNTLTTCSFNLDDAYSFRPSESEIDNREDAFGKDRAKTSRKNWLFWIRRDTEKLLKATEDSIQPPEVQMVPAPPLGKLTEALSKVSGRRIYLDIETDIESDTLDCIGFSIDDSPKVYVVPVYRWNGNLAYEKTQLLRFLATLSSALLRNQVIIHNCMYDLLWLSSHQRLTFGRDIYDTMVAHKRIHPEIEKSLAHCISLYTNFPYHKDEHTLSRTAATEQRLWHYNAKDVAAMRAVHLAQLEIINKDKGLRISVNQAMESLYPYLLASLKGLRVNLGTLSAAKIAADRRITQIKRIILTLIGDPKFNPDSPVQLVKYFHETLAYKVVSRSKKTGKPSLGGKELYELALKYDNPLIQCILNYRELTKERGMMDFNNHQFPWELL